MHFVSEAARKFLSTFNLFRTESSTALTQRRERISTYLYIILLTTFITLLIFYTGFVERSKHDTMVTPSLSEYDRLQNIYSDTLQCPCSKTSIPYNAFIFHLNATFHPICSSEFITSKWSDYFNANVQHRVWWIQKEDFRFWGVLFFKLLESFCFLAKSIVADAILNFQSTLLISSEMMPLTIFEAQIHERLRLFQKSTSNLLIRPIEVSRAIVQGNALISTLGSNWQLETISAAADLLLLSVPMTYSNGTCSCATSKSCLKPAAFVNLTHHKVYLIKDVFSGCSSLESILFSSLSCFFSNSCILDIMDAMALGDPGDFPRPRIDIAPLQSLSFNSPFKVNDTIETIVYRLFIDSWLNETSYEDYYNACAPVQCTYSYGKRFDIAYILTIFLSVYSAFSMGLYFAVPRVVNFGFILREKIRI